MPLYIKCGAIAAGVLLASCMSSKTVAVETSPPGANVSIDGFFAGTSPCQCVFPRRKTFVVEVLPPEDSSELLWPQRRTVQWSLIPDSGGLLAFDLHWPSESSARNPDPSRSKDPSSTASDTVRYGTGFLVGDRLVLTANHVAEQARRIVVTVGEHGDIEAEVMARDSRNDVCLLRLENPVDSSPLRFAAAGSLQTGERVFILGFPLATIIDRKAPSIGDGIIANLQGLGADISTFQITAPSNAGNSGGPVLDASGNIVGVLLSRLSDYYSLATDQGVPQGVNFAIKGEIIRALLRDHVVGLETGQEQESAMTAQQVHAAAGSSVFLVRAEGGPDRRESAPR